MSKRIHTGVPFTDWTPEDDRLIMAARPLSRKERRRGVSELQHIADRLGRTYAAVCIRRSRLMRGVAKTR